MLYMYNKALILSANRKMATVMFVTDVREGMSHVNRMSIYVENFKMLVTESCQQQNISVTKILELSSSKYCQQHH